MIAGLLAAHNAHVQKAKAALVTASLTIEERSDMMGALLYGERLEQLIRQILRTGKIPSETDTDEE